MLPYQQEKEFLSSDDAPRRMISMTVSQRG